MYPLSLFNICYGCTCPEMRTADTLINGKCQLGLVTVFIGFSIFLAQNAHFTSSSETEQIKFLLLSNKEAVRLFPLLLPFSLTLFIVMLLCRKYHRILGMESTLKVHTVFSHALVKLFPTQSRKTFWGKKEKSQFTYCLWNFKMCSIANLNTMHLSLYCPIGMTLEVIGTSCQVKRTPKSIIQH